MFVTCASKSLREFGSAGEVSPSATAGFLSEIGDRRPHLVEPFAIFRNHGAEEAAGSVAHDVLCVQLIVNDSRRPQGASRTRSRCIGGTFGTMATAGPKEVSRNRSPDCSPERHEDKVEERHPLPM